MKNLVRVLIVAFTALLAVVILPSSPVHAQTDSAQTSASCAQMPAGADATKFTPEDFARYGLPPLGHMPLQKWHQIVDGTKHVCGGGSPSSHIMPQISTYNTSGSQINGSQYSSNWEGNVTEGSTSYPPPEGNYYDEADAVFYVPSTPSTTYGNSAFWVGLGGVNGSQTPGNGQPSLTQAGINYTYDTQTGRVQYFAWVENVGATTSQGNQGCSGPYWCQLSLTSYPVSSGDRIQVVINQNQMYIGSSRGWRNTWTYGPNPDNSTAEWIVEDNYQNYPGQMDNFGTVTFYGMGDTQSNGTYTGPYWQNHYYYTLYNAYTGHPILNIGSLLYNTTWGPPNDSNAISWNPTYGGL